MKINNDIINQLDFKTVIDNAAEGVCIIQGERIVYHNDAAIKITGYPSEIYIRTPILNIFDSEDAKRMVQRYKQRLAGEQVPPISEARFIRYDGSHGWMQSTSSQTMWKGKLATVNFFIDITDRKSLEEELNNKKKEIESLLVSDNLTGLYNRRYLDNQVVKEIERSNRYKYPMCLAIIDIDNFKKVNDTFGHDCGDKVIKQLANLLQTKTRLSDVAARWGGEEFCLILPETKLKKAHFLLDNLRKEFQNKYISCVNYAVTFSAGVAELDIHDTSITLFSRTDKALYKAKNEGRNKVISFIDD
ncbi:sensor domain-containing diguanylate cyclase [Helicovermis profundi]|uniref:Diguanylate cyclase n=1 Tax=Helicovermis profundi TaxID=3065157 RepID=A0AAU9E0E6_9FIRM|nr:hypothetical protein HLPR_03370 [Clostridia bacterium S502]